MSEDARMFCTFRSAGRLFGVPILDVKEVTTETHCTRIPHAPPEVLGYVNIRGHVFLALDLRRLLRLPGETPAADRRLVIFKANVGPAFGAIVDEIGDIIAVPPDQIEDAPTDEIENRSRDRSSLIVKIAKLSSELLLVLEPRRFLAVVERAISER